jgi:hypothetical protein
MKLNPLNMAIGITIGAVAVTIPIIIAFSAFSEPKTGEEETSSTSFFISGHVRDISADYLTITQHFGEIDSASECVEPCPADINVRLDQGYAPFGCVNLQVLSSPDVCLKKFYSAHLPKDIIPVCAHVHLRDGGIYAGKIFYQRTCIPSEKTGDQEQLSSPEPDKIIQIEKNKEITIVNADSSVGETFHTAVMTVNNVTFFREQHPTENISIKLGFGTLFFNYTIKNNDDTAFYAHVEIESIVEGKRYPYQLVSGAMGELLLPGENRGSWIAFQVPTETVNVIFEIRDPRTQNLHWTIEVDLLQD